MPPESPLQARGCALSEPDEEELAELGKAGGVDRGEQSALRRRAPPLAGTGCPRPAPRARTREWPPSFRSRVWPRNPGAMVEASPRSARAGCCLARATARGPATVRRATVARRAAQQSGEHRRGSACPGRRPGSLATRPDLGRDGGLAQVELVGGGRQAAGLDDLEENPERIEALIVLHRQSLWLTSGCACWNGRVKPVRLGQ